MKILITGARGMLGSALCDLFIDRGEVFGFHRDLRFSDPNWKSVSVDLLDMTKTQEHIKRINPDLMIHCAGLVNIDRCEEMPISAIKTNVIVTRNLVSSINKSTTLVYISSDQVYGNCASRTEEQSGLTPLNVYGRTKLRGEAEALAHTGRTLVLRTNIVAAKPRGKKKEPSFAEWVISALREGRELHLFTDYFFSPIHVLWLGDVIYRLLEKDFAGTLNVGSRNCCSKYEFGKTLAKVGNFDPGVIRKASIQQFAGATLRNSNLCLDVEKLITLGIMPPKFQETAERLFEEYQAGHA